MEESELARSLTSGVVGYLGRDLLGCLEPTEGKRQRGGVEATGRSRPEPAATRDKICSIARSRRRGRGEEKSQPAVDHVQNQQLLGTRSARLLGAGGGEEAEEGSQSCRRGGVGAGGRSRPEPTATRDDICSVARSRWRGRGRGGEESGSAEGKRQRRGGVSVGGGEEAEEGRSQSRQRRRGRGGEESEPAIAHVRSRRLLGMRFARLFGADGGEEAEEGEVAADGRSHPEPAATWDEICSVAWSRWRGRGKTGGVGAGGRSRPEPVATRNEICSVVRSRRRGRDRGGEESEPTVAHVQSRRLLRTRSAREEGY